MMRNGSIKAWVGLACLAGVTGLASAQTPTAPNTGPAILKAPTLELVSPRVDFGTRPPLAFVSETMTFINNGEQPITLERAQGECSCTDATILGNDRTFQPGERFDILVAVEFPREMGLYTKQLLIYEKDNERPLPIPFDFEVGYDIKINGGPRFAIVTDRGGKLTLESRTKSPFRVLSISGMAPIYEGFDPAKDSLRDNYTVYYNLGEVPTDQLPRWLVIETDHEAAEMMAIPARVPGWRPIIDKTQWHSMDEFIAMGTVSSNGPTRTTMLFTGKAVMPGQKIVAKSTNPDIGVRVVGVRRPDRGGGMQVDFDVTPRRDLTGFSTTIASVEYDGVRTAFDLFLRADPSMPAPPVPNN